MATRQIKHRLGNIEYEYNDQVPWTEVDQQMADGLAHCLLVSDQSQEAVGEVFMRSIEFSKTVKELNENLKQVAALLKQAQVLAGGYIGAIELKQYAIADQLVEAANLANEAVMSQYKALTDAHTEYSSILHTRNALVEKEEDENTLVFDKLDGLFILGHDAGNVATDLMSFDRAEERARSVISVNERSQETRLDLVLSHIQEFELYMAKVEGHNQLWDQFAASLVLIEYIGKLRSGNQLSSFN